MKMTDDERIAKWKTACLVLMQAGRAMGDRDGKAAAQWMSAMTVWDPKLADAVERLDTGRHGEPKLYRHVPSGLVANLARTDLETKLSFIAWAHRVILAGAREGFLDATPAADN
ncbi:MAG: hypothetical protein LBR22_04945 [Desulfovibrio sp.]|jgi:hypothetical protein|nr:hypothetical protein [Desulfovibrio sp.]